MCPIPVSAQVPVLRSQAVLTPATSFAKHSGREDRHLSLYPKSVGTSLACAEQGSFRNLYK